MQVNSPSVSSGTTLPIFRSTDSITWTLNSPQSSCTLDSALMCTFTTDHLSYFGFVRVTSTPITVVTTTTMITSGPGGGGGSNTVYLAGIPIIPTFNTALSDFLVPSIVELLKKNIQTAEVGTTQNNSIHTVNEPITNYICPVVKKVNSLEDVSSVSEGEFTQDVQSILMYRGLDNNQDSLSLDYIADQASGIAKNSGDYQ